MECSNPTHLFLSYHRTDHTITPWARPQYRIAATGSEDGELRTGVPAKRRGVTADQQSIVQTLSPAAGLRVQRSSHQKKNKGQKALEKSLKKALILSKRHISLILIYPLLFFVFFPLPM